MSRNGSESFPFWRARASSLSLSLLSTGQPKNPKKLLRITCVMLSRSPRPVCCDLSHNAQRAQRRHTVLFTAFLTSMSYLFPVNVLCVKDIWPGQSDCFPLQVKCKWSFPRMYLYIECLFWQDHAHVRWPMKAVEKKKKQKKKASEKDSLPFFFFFFSNSSIGCLMWYWSVDILTHSELSCQLYRLKTPSLLTLHGTLSSQDLK